MLLIFCGHPIIFSLIIVQFVKNQNDCTYFKIIGSMPKLTWWLIIKSEVRNQKFDRENNSLNLIWAFDLNLFENILIDKFQTLESEHGQNYSKNEIQLTQQNRRMSGPPTIQTGPTNPPIIPSACLCTCGVFLSLSLSLSHSLGMGRSLFRWFRFLSVFMLR